jgi:hypothetical protein
VAKDNVLTIKLHVSRILDSLVRQTVRISPFLRTDRGCKTTWNRGHFWHQPDLNNASWLLDDAANRAWSPQSPDWAIPSDEIRYEIASKSGLGSDRGSAQHGGDNALAPSVTAQVVRLWRYGQMVLPREVQGVFRGEL